MTLNDIPEVGAVERRCFSNPWPASAYRRELKLPSQNFYIVLRETSDLPAAASDADGRGNGNGASDRAVPRRPLLPLVGRRYASPARAEPMVGFAGMWLLYDEAHITTVGVLPEYRGRHLGELLLVALIDEALRRGANWLTLEVRVSNEAAQRLYRKYGFAVQGTRRRYYSDNNEDAFIMWSPALGDAAYRETLRGLLTILETHVGPTGLRFSDEPRVSPAWPAVGE